MTEKKDDKTIEKWEREHTLMMVKSLYEQIADFKAENEKLKEIIKKKLWELDVPEDDEDFISVIITRKKEVDE